MNEILKGVLFWVKVISPPPHAGLADLLKGIPLRIAASVEVVLELSNTN